MRINDDPITVVTDVAIASRRLREAAGNPHAWSLATWTTLHEMCREMYDDAERALGVVTHADDLKRQQS